MTDANTSAEAPALAPLPPVLTPRDESRIAFARSVWAVWKSADRLVPIDPEALPGSLLTDALALQADAEKTVGRAVVAERERGTTWEQIAQAAGITRQTAHERWAHRARAWADNGRTANAPGHTSAETARFLDSEYALAHPDQPHAVTAGLDAVRYPGSAADQDARRARGRALHTRREDLERDADRLHEEWVRLKDPADRRGELRLAANLTAAADVHNALADLYQELAAAEPELAEEHLGDVATWRERATQNQSYADSALDRAGTA
ncbi:MULTISPECIES: hypothetical protein [Actinomycetes]|uniref:hypothetical protein n=1 Tax=Actinomycetes TaxID=1760 RepID=UPI0034213D53